MGGTNATRSPKRSAAPPTISGSTLQSTPRISVPFEQNQPPVPADARQLGVGHLALGHRRTRRAAGGPPRPAGTGRACRGDRPRGRRRRDWWAARPEPEPAVSTNGSALALLAEAKVLERDHHHEREGVVDAAQVDVVGRHAGASNAIGPETAAGDPCEVGPLAHRRVRDVLAVTEHPHRLRSGSRRTRSSAASITAQPPSDRMQHCSFVNGSAIIVDRTARRRS